MTAPKENKTHQLALAVRIYPSFYELSVIDNLVLCVLIGANLYKDLRMKLNRFIAILKSDTPGLIFWQNLCAHWHEKCVDSQKVAAVLKDARQAIDAYSWSGDKEGSSWAYQSIISETNGKQSRSAIDSLVNSPALDWSKIRKVSTLIDQNSFWTHYVNFSPIGHTEILETVGVMSGSLDSISEEDLKEELLKTLQEMSENTSSVADRLWDSMTEGKFLRTGADRFWASFDDSKRSKNPDDLVPQLGLTKFKPGSWVIEIEFEGEHVKLLLERNGAEMKRPSALCVNDTEQPRFRALRPDEVKNRRVQSNDRLNAKLNWHGTTLDLKHWPPSGISIGMHHMNGLPELLSPQLPWKNAGVKPALKILGKIPSGGETERCVSMPNNEAYAEYLGELFSIACANDDAFIIELEANGG